MVLLMPLLVKYTYMYSWNYVKNSWVCKLLMKNKQCRTHRRSQGEPRGPCAPNFSISSHFVLWEVASQTNILLFACSQIFDSHSFGLATPLSDAHAPIHCTLPLPKVHSKLCLETLLPHRQALQGLDNMRWHSFTWPTHFSNPKSTINQTNK